MSRGQVYRGPVVLFAGASSQKTCFLSLASGSLQQQEWQPWDFLKFEGTHFSQGQLWFCCPGMQAFRVMEGARRTLYDSGTQLVLQVQVSLPEPRKALSSWLRRCGWKPGPLEPSGLFSLRLLNYFECLPILFQVREISTNDFNPLFGWFLLGPEPHISGSLESLLGDVKRQLEFTCQPTNENHQALLLFMSTVYFFSSSHIPVGSTAHLFCFYALNFMSCILAFSIRPSV